ncbi:MAG TPA: lamin tail domain-containing protein, partial [Ferruginibacter sp.]|nr:lamin tail domain-containing protein [Ferruginibacter sp.]
MKKIFTFLLLLCCMAGFSQSTTIVISQVYGAGGNSGALFNADYVELHNISATSQSLNGLSVQYESATPAGNWSGAAVLPNVSIPAGGYFLVQMTAAGSVGSPLPTPDFVGDVAMGGTNGIVAIINGVDVITGCPSSNVIDLVGYGTAACFEGAAASPGISATLAAFRLNNGCTDTDVNGNDFSTGAPAPRNSASPAFICGSGPTPQLTITGTINDFGSLQVGNTSASQTYNLSGSNLTGAPGNIVVSAPSADFQVSGDNSTWTASVNIPFTSATLASTPVYVRFSPQSAGLKSGNVTNSGGGAATVNVAVSGTGTSSGGGTGTLVISQFYGAGGNTGAVLNADYVEIHNISAVSQSLNGLSVQYESATPAGTWSGAAVLPNVSIPPGGFYLVQMTTTPGSIGAPLPTPDFAADVLMGGSNGIVAIINGTTVISGCPSTDVIDLVGYGTAACFEGGGAAPAVSATLAGFRADNGCTDTDNNNADFSTGAPAPRNSASPVQLCSSVPSPSLTVTGTIADFGNVDIGTNSTSQSYSLSGANLTGAPGVIT